MFKPNLGGLDEFENSNLTVLLDLLSDCAPRSGKANRYHKDRDRHNQTII